jgi:dienelactone hydrolase
MHINTGFHQITTPEGSMEAYFAIEEGRDHLPVMIVCQEAFGVNHHIKDEFQHAGHGFFCNERSSYYRPSAEEAWKLTLEFLKQNA